jgi:glycerophosphoryl diester phosphodiesterase
MAIPDKIKQLANDIRSKVYGREVRESLAKGIEEAGDLADKANTKSENAVYQVNNIQAQVNQLVVEGDSSVEAAQARVDAEGKSYPTLKARLDAKETEFSSQLAQTEQDIEKIKNKINRVKFSELQEPIFIAHRGGSNIFPENTLEAYEGCLSMGLNIIELDVQQLADGTLAVMHDLTMDRTTNRTGYVRNYTTMGFKRAKVNILPGWDDVHPPLFEEVLSRFGNNAIYIIESKDRISSRKIVETLKKYRLEEYAMVTSFSLEDLQTIANEGIPRLLATDNINPQEIINAGIEYVGVSTNISESYIQNCINAGLKVIVYTVNRRYERDKFLGMGVSGFFTDDPLYVQNKSPVLSMDPFGEQIFTHGIMSPPAVDPYLGYDRGTFLPGDKFGWPEIAPQLSHFSLQGWAGELPETVTIEAKIVYEKLSAASRWGSIAFCTPYDFFNDQTLSGKLTDGYHLLIRESGSMELFRIMNGEVVQLGIIQTPAITERMQVPIKIEVTQQTIKATRLDTNDVLQVDDTSHRGGYLHVGRREAGITFRDIYIS